MIPGCLKYGIPGLFIKIMEVWEMGRRKTGRRTAVAVLIACISMGAFPAPVYAAKLPKMTFVLKGDLPKSGEYVDETVPEVTASGSGEKFRVESVEYANERVKWERNDIPELAITIYYDYNYELNEEILKKTQVRGMNVTYDHSVWLNDDIDPDSEESPEEMGVCLYFTFPSLSTPGNSVKERQAEIEAEAQKIAAKSPKRAALYRKNAVLSGWYHDGIGWWYLEDDNTWHTNEWKKTGASWSYLNDNGYAATGWFQVKGLWYYADANGTLFTDTVTPDGFKVNSDGVWVQ